VGYGDGISISIIQIIQCYALGKVNAIYNGAETGDFMIGGIAGHISYTTVDECYAAGEVEAESTHGFPQAGGLIGNANNSTISNSYTLGNVMANGVDGAFAGGLVGTILNGTVQFSFSKSLVNAHSVSGGVYAGSIVGYIDSDENDDNERILQNNAALGTVVSAIGGDDRRAARMYAYPESLTNADNNYAIKTMVLEEDTWENRFDPAHRDDVVSDPTGIDGKDAGIGSVYSKDFWTGALQFSSIGEYYDDFYDIIYIEWDYSHVWDYSRVGTLGYPVHKQTIGAP
jgi:hypothetical protein